MQNPNVVHYDAMFDGEFDAIAGRHYTAASHFEVGVLFAGRSGLTQDFALAHERFGEYLARRGPDYVQDAEHHLKEAIKLYTEWGALAKARQVQNEHRDLLCHTEVQVEMPFSTT